MKLQPTSGVGCGLSGWKAHLRQQLLVPGVPPQSIVGWLPQEKGQLPIPHLPALPQRRRLLEGVEKAVLRHPLTIMPKPAVFPSHRTAHTLLERLTVLEERPGWAKVPGVVATAMRG